MDNNANDQQPIQATPDTTGASGLSPAEPAQPQPVSSNPQPVAAISPEPSSLGTIFDQIAEKIIEQQEAIIGPIAVDQAKLVGELKINWPQHEVDIEGSPQVAIDDLVAQYKELFGQIAVETCKEAVAKLLAQVPADQQPSSLKS